MNPLVAAAGIGAAGSLFGSAASGMQNAKLARETREWQEKMSNTAYQRAADDLEAAGLNRILALGSPATTPGGATATFPDMGSSFAQGAQAGISYGSTAQDISQSKATIKKLMAETSLANSKAATELEKSKVFQAIGPIIAQAGKDFSKLNDFIRDPARIGELKMIIDKEKNNVLNYLDTFLFDIYGGRYRGSAIDGLLERAGSKKGGRINLGSGGPQ